MYLRKLRGLVVRMTGLFNKEQQDREMAEELDCILAMHIEDHLRAGLAPAEARRRALIEIGGETTKEEYRRQRGLPLIEATLQDLRYALRMLAKRRGFAVIAILSLGLGIGANTAIFSVVNTAILRPFPVERPDQLVALQNAGELRTFAGFSYPNYKDYRDRNEVLDGLIGYHFAQLSVSHDGTYEKLWGYLVTGNYFEVLGLKPALGRLLSTDDDRFTGGHPVTVIAYRYWQESFGSDPTVIGKNLIVNGRAFTIIGVAPKGFLGTEIVVAPQMWFPMAMQGEIELGNSSLTKRGVEATIVLGRLKPGITVARAEANLNSIAAQLEQEYPDENEGKRVVITRPGSGATNGMLRGAILSFAGALMAAVGLVLLLACTNLVNLLLARSTERRNEIAVRLALGASRGRIVKQLLAESMLLAAASGLFGLFIAYCLVGLATSVKLPTEVPLVVDLHIDYRVLFFTFVTSILTGILFGLLPAIQATKVDLQSSLKDETSFGGYRRSWSRNCLIVFQVALSLVLLVAGGLTLRALQRAQTLSFGFNPQNALAVSFDLRLQGYNSANGSEFQRHLLERVRTLPGVQSVGTIDLAPVDLHFSRGAVVAEGQAPERQSTNVMISRTSPGYFQAMGVRILQGRDFNDQDDENTPRVVIVNATLANQFWPGQDPIGKRMAFGNQPSPSSQMMQVVGVVQDGKYASLSEDPQPYLCRPVRQSYVGATTMIVRTSADPAKMLATIRNEVLQMDAHIPISGAPLTEKLSFPLLPARVTAWLFGFFGLLALLLAAIGVYGVMSFIISMRTHEIGVRMALGAEASDVLRLTIVQGMTLSTIGVVIGIAAALALTQSMKSLLFGVSATDPMTYVLVGLLLIAVTVLACYLPARRATKISPMIALRTG